MAAYKPGDYYIADSGILMQYDGSVWKNKGQIGTPSTNQIIQSNTKVNPPGAQSNPNIGTGAYQQQAGNNTGQNTKIEVKFKNTPRVTVSNKTNGVLRYPHEFSISSTSDYVVFEFFEYMPPFGREQGAEAGRILTDLTESSAYNLYNRSGMVNDHTQESSTVKPIILYMPEDIQSQYGSRWGGADFATAAVGAMRTMGGTASLPVGLQNIPGLAKNTVYNELLKQINEYTGSTINLNQVLASVSGTILNPNTEMLYQGQDLRTFSLSFKMSPRTDKEAKVIKQICNRFKKASMPYIGGQAIFGQFKSPNLLKVPVVCQVTFMNGNKHHEYLPKYKLCAISGVEINYTPDGSYATVGKDGSPVSTQLTVSFKETKTLFGDDINIEETGASY